MTAFERSHWIRPGSFGSTVPVTVADPSLWLRTLIFTVLRAVTVTSGEPMFSATARRSLVSAMAIFALKLPSAALVTLVSAFFLFAVRVIVTGRRHGPGGPCR